MMRALLFSVVFLAGCTGWTEEDPPVPELAVEVSGGVRPAAPASKTSASGSAVSFGSGDRIGISETLTGRSNVLFSYNGSAWSTTTPMYWYNRTATHTFYAYYPYNASNQSNVVPMPVLANQQVSTAVDVACDMLVTGPKQQAYPAGSSVAFVFSHAFSVLQFNITMGVINTYTLKSLTLRGGNTASGSSGYGIVNTVNTVAQIGYNLVTGAVQAAANNSSVYAQTLTKSIPSTGLIGSIPVTVYVLALPGQYLNPVPAVKFTVAPLIGSNQDTDYANLSNNTFSAGTKYVYNVKIGGIITKVPQPCGAAGKLPVTIERDTVINLSNKSFIH